MSESTAIASTRLPALKKWLYLALSLMLGGSLLLSYMQWEAKSVEYRDEQLPADCLPALSGARILVLSDVHSDLKTLEKAVELAQDKKPDIIFFLGDLYTDHARATRGLDFIETFKKLSQLAPAYAVLGNHDLDRVEKTVHVLTRGGFTVLRNSAVQINLKGQNVYVCGLGEYREGDCLPQQCLPRLEDAAVPHETPVILLSHNPKSREILAPYRWHLMLCGHTHGGQIKLPFFRPLLISSGEAMAEGLYPFEGGRYIFVTPGIGSTGPGRLNCPPEVNMLIIP